jgi:uncharacterized protein (DUF433 family)
MRAGSAAPRWRARQWPIRARVLDAAVVTADRGLRLDPRRKFACFTETGYDGSGELVMGTAPSVIRIDPDILSGTPCFAGTRVPVQTLLDYLKAGDRIADFLEDFPTVTHEQVDAVLEIAGEAVTRHARTP